MAADYEYTLLENERQRSLNEYWSCKYGNWNMIWSLLSITAVLPAFVGKTESNKDTVRFGKCVSVVR